MKEYRNRPGVREKINKYQNLRYHNGKPITLEYAKKKSKEYYHNNDDYRINKLKDQKEYYYNNLEKFKEYGQSDRAVKYHHKYRQRPEVKVRLKKWLEENKDKVKLSNRAYQIKNKDKIRLRVINKKRKENGFDPAVDLKQHFNDRKQYWYKKVVYASQYGNSKENNK